MAPLNPPHPLLAPRHLRAGGLVLAAHLGLAWLITLGLSPRPPELLVPAEMLAQVLEPTPRAAAPTPPVPKQPPPAPAKPTPPPPRPAPAPSLAPAPSPTPPLPPASPSPPTPPSASPNPAPAASNSASALAAASTATAAAAPAPASPATAPAAPAPVQLPSTNADYLQNPKPAYPTASLRLGESGRSVHRVWIGPDGRPQKAELVRSSGYPRLDKAAHDAVMGWRYVPGKRGGVPELMAFDVPIVWELPN